MTEVSFPVAERVVVYLIDGRPHTKVTEREGKLDPSSVRALDHDRVAWFTPLNSITVREDESETNKPEGEAG